MKLDLKSFILTYAAFSQLVKESQELFQAKKVYVGIKFKIKDDVAVTSLRKEEDESLYIATYEDLT